MDRAGSIARDIYTVARHEHGWAVEFNGDISNVSKDKDEAKASAHKLARAASESGRAAMVVISGDMGYFPMRRAEPLATQ
jgi:hypothetical protein